HVGVRAAGVSVVVVENPLAAVEPVRLAINLFRLLAEKYRVDVFLVERSARVPAQGSVRLGRDAKLLLEVVAFLVLAVVEDDERRAVEIFHVVVLVSLVIGYRREGRSFEIVVTQQASAKNVPVVEGACEVVVINGQPVGRNRDGHATVETW